MSTIHSIFVYGTLKQLQLRAPMWPCKPISIQPAMIRATLYDTGPYPAILQGTDCILGELWTLAIDDMPKTLEILDEVEGFDVNRRDNLYVRIETEATLGDGTKVHVYAYRYALQEAGATLRRIRPLIHFAGHVCAAWPDPFSRVPKSLAEE